MIFGFNTDIRCGDTVYHVQTEARQAERLLESAIFVRGRCIGKHGVSYADQVASPEFCDQYIHDLLTQQHRSVVNAVREGNVDLILAPAANSQAGSSQAASPPAVAQQEPPELEIDWVAAESSFAGSDIRLRFHVHCDGSPADNAEVVARLEGEIGGPYYARSSAGNKGAADIRFDLQDGVAAQPFTVLVQASHAGRSVRRKFRLRKN